MANGQIPKPTANGQQSKASGMSIDFYDACYEGNIAAVQCCLMQNRKQYNFNLAMENACFGGHVSIVDLMITKGANKWNDGFYAACCNGNLKLVQLMISKGANEWNYALSGACRGGQIDTMRFLVSRGANDWSAGLCGACYSGNMEIAEYMISKGADFRGEGCINILYDACDGFKRGFGSIKMIHLVISKKTFDRIHHYFSWPLHDLEIAQLLYLGTPINEFKLVDGFQKLEAKINLIQKTIKNQNVLILDLLNIIARCIIV